MALVPDNKNHGGVQIVNLTGKHTYQLDEDALREILLHEDVKDLPVVLVSVAGAYRGGKSFLLNFFLRYLTAPEETRDENGTWLGAEAQAGFNWRGGVERDTTGILMWPKPFIITLPSTEKVAVFLMDTQGTFDSGSTMRDCSTIFALSTLVSSVQIYNIKENIKEDDLQHLQLFTEYGKAIKKAEGTKPFQVLEFLIRDWQYEYDHEYGQKGGEELLEKRLKITAEMVPELSELRQHICGCFEKVTCFLMPHPGRSVRKKNFSGKLSELDEEFKDALKELVPSIFAPANLTPKMMNGDTVKARDLFTYFKEYMAIFNSDKVPSVKSIMKATSQAALLAAAQDARELYEARMARVSSAPESLPSTALEVEHRKALADAVVVFSGKKTMATKKESNSCQKQLLHELQKRLDEFVKINNGKLLETVTEAKKAFEDTVYRSHKERLLCLHPLDLDELFKNAKIEALKIFDAGRTQFDNIEDLERLKFKQILQREYEELRFRNESHNKLFESSMRMEFSNKMMFLLSNDPPLDNDEFILRYEEAKADTLAAFDSKRNKASQHPEDPYKTSLMQAMSEQFIHLQEINKRKDRRILQTAINSYNEHIKQFWNPDQCCLHPEDLKTEHEIAKSKAIEFQPTQNAHINDSDKQLIFEILDSKYKDMKDRNDSLNEMAVSAALRVFSAYMDEKTAFNGWWLLLIPWLVHLAYISTYRQEATDIAMTEFNSHRRQTKSLAYDPYLGELENKLEEEGAKY